MRHSFLAVLLSLVLVPVAHAAGAPGIDVTVGAYGWQAQPSGSFSTTANNDDDVDVEDDLDYDSNRNNVFVASLEHPVPLVPNVSLGAADISDSQNATLSRDLQYNGVTFGSASRDVTSEYQLDYTEATLYYSPWETVAKIDVGITARRLDANFAIQERDGSNRQSVTATATLPMIHAGVRADLPLTGFHVKGKVDAISYDGNSLTDATAAVGYRSDFNLGLELGYRRMALTLDDVEDLNADFNLGGPYLSLSIAI